MKSPTEYSQVFAVSIEDLRPRAATKVALSEILAARIRQHARRTRLVFKHAAKAREERDQ